MRYQTNNLLGIGLMMLAMFLFMVMDAVAKWLVSAELSAIQVIAVRSWMITIMILVILAIRGELSELVTRNPLRHALRGIIGFFAPFSFLFPMDTANCPLPIAISQTHLRPQPTFGNTQGAQRRVWSNL